MYLIFMCNSLLLKSQGFSPAYKQMKACDYRQGRKCYGINIKSKDIRVEFKGRDVLDINELEVYDYDRIGLVGANGAGKALYSGYFRRINSPGM